MSASNLDPKACCCPPAEPMTEDPAEARGPRSRLLRYLGMGPPLLVAWILFYVSLESLAKFLTYRVLGLPAHEHLSHAVEFFVFETPKVVLLLTLVVFGVGIVRSFFTPERTCRILAGKRESAGNVLAALLGVVTPFCTCSAVPLFIGFVTSGVPLGVTFSFLISAPMVNEIAVVLLLGLFGWKVAVVYMGTGLLVAVTAGWVIGRLSMERHLEEWVLELRTSPACVAEDARTWADRIEYGGQAVREIVGKVWVYVVLGIAVGAGIHGYVPEGLLASFMGKSAWWSLPLAVLLGVPMYSNAAGIIPVVHALLEKGAALGTALAFMMAVIGLSLPEAVILRKVLKPRLIGVFFGAVAAGILVVGAVFNFLL